MGPLTRTHPTAYRRIDRALELAPLIVGMTVVALMAAIVLAWVVVALV